MSQANSQETILWADYSQELRIFGKISHLRFLGLLLFKFSGCGLPRCTLASLRLTCKRLEGQGWSAFLNAAGMAGAMREIHA